ncbi:hypothetical protein [Streptomyces sp. MI02-7b]|uniref:hypothetical protein n=1 Tax=Streptomyces sp. MI02-7b TaxID=462941 RepID=UPI0029BCC212|nr:hypothetical protein [Streptomyces sp. MI02-7b]MDX3074602.1 hypothetical protein [Streptomyces sp. MI02-7b]
MAAGAHCPTRKWRYRDRIAAQLVLAVMDRTDPRRRECRAYHCPLCHGWHLTSQRQSPARNRTASPMHPYSHHHDQQRSTMSDNSLSSDTVAALLEVIKEQAEEIKKQPASVGSAAAIKDLAEAYAWVMRPIRGTSR